MKFHRLGAAALALSALAVMAGCSSDSNPGPGVSYLQVDRAALPAVNTALIPAGQKDAFNQGAPSTDVTNFRTPVLTTINALRAATDSILPPEDSPGVAAATVTDLVIPYITTIDFGVSGESHFPNGRSLDDDVIDAALGLILNRGDVLGGGSGVSDGINSNDRTTLSAFPYLATPNP